MQFLTKFGQIIGWFHSFGIGAPPPPGLENPGSAALVGCRESMTPLATSTLSATEQ